VIVVEPLPGQTPVVQFSAENGSWVRIVGASGTGKTAFGHLLTGLRESPTERVTLLGEAVAALPPETRARSVALVPSDPSLVFSGLKSTLAGELNLAARMSPCSAREYEGRTDGRTSFIVDAFALGALLARDPFTLSGGEAARAAIAIAVLKEPRLLVLDQVTDELDPDARKVLGGTIGRALSDEAIVIELSARDTVSECEDLGTVSYVNSSAAQAPDPACPSWRVTVRPRVDLDETCCGPRAGAHRQLKPASINGPLLSVKQLSYRYGETGFELGPIDFEAFAGERIALTGPNGAGKTTLLRCLAMLLRPSFVSFEICQGGLRATPPEGDRNLHLWAKQALYCFQRPEDQLYLPTVREEISETLRRLGCQSAAEAGWDIADRLGLTPFLDAAPFDLARPYRRLIPIAAAFAVEPPLLLLDEPTVGLDDAQVKTLIDLIAQRATHSVILMISHDLPFIAAASCRTLALGAD
jgi:energy-coupling factor transport system ATP-binding protein